MEEKPKLHREQIIARARLQSENIGQMLLDYAHWNENVRKPGEEPIDVDPDGLLRKLKEGIDHMLADEDTRPIPAFMSPEDKARLQASVSAPHRPVPRAPRPLPGDAEKNP